MYSIFCLILQTLYSHYSFIKVWHTIGCHVLSLSYQFSNSWVMKIYTGEDVYIYKEHRLFWRLLILYTICKLYSTDVHTMCSLISIITLFFVMHCRLYSYGLYPNKPKIVFYITVQLYNKNCSLLFDTIFWPKSICTMYIIWKDSQILQYIQYLGLYTASPVYIQYSWMVNRVGWFFAPGVYVHCTLYSIWKDFDFTVHTVFGAILYSIPSLHTVQLNGQ